MDGLGLGGIEPLPWLRGMMWCDEVDVSVDHRRMWFSYAIVALRVGRRMRCSGIPFSLDVGLIWSTASPVGILRRLQMSVYTSVFYIVSHLRHPYHPYSRFHSTPLEPQWRGVKRDKVPFTQRIHEICLLKHTYTHTLLSRATQRRVPRRRCALFLREAFGPDTSVGTRAVPS